MIGEIIGTLLAISFFGLIICGFLIVILILWIVTR
jgi:hypothetical protein